MRRSSMFLVAAMAVFASMSLFLPAQDKVDSRVIGRDQWEYRVLLMSDIAKGKADDQAAAVETKFNELGREGWEFSQIHLKVAVLKRRKR